MRSRKPALERALDELGQHHAERRRSNIHRRRIREGLAKNAKVLAAHVRISEARDAANYLEFHRLCLLVNAHDRAGLLVIASNPFVPLPSFTDIPCPVKASVHSKLWYRQRSKLDVTPIKNHSWSPYDRLSANGKLQQMHDALWSMCFPDVVWAVTADVGNELHERLIKDSQPLKTMSTRIAASLKRRNLSAEYWFHIERQDGQIHLNGEVLVSHDLIGEFREALRDALDEWVTNQDKQVKIKQWPDAGWIGYSTKDKASTGRLSTRFGCGIPGSAYTAMKRLRIKAKEIYNQRRAFFSKHRAVMHDLVR